MEEKVRKMKKLDSKHNGLMIYFIIIILYSMFMANLIADGSLIIGLPWLIMTFPTSIILKGDMRNLLYLILVAIVQTFLLYLLILIKQNFAKKR
jgi:hypothetical protein